MPAVGVNPGGKPVREGTREEPAANSRGGVAPLQDGGGRLPGLRDRRHGDEGSTRRQASEAPPTRNPQSSSGAPLEWLSGKEGFFYTTALELWLCP